MKAVNSSIRPKQSFAQSVVGYAKKIGLSEMAVQRAGEAVFTAKGVLSSSLKATKGRGIFVLTSGRSGSTYFCDLLDSHPAIRMQGELLKFRRKCPRLFLAGLLQYYNECGMIWGFKAKLWHLALNEIDPAGFLRNLADNGWLIIHLWRRDRVRQALSTWVARIRNDYHNVSNRAVNVPPANAVSATYKAIRALDDECKFLKQIPHMSIELQTNLSNLEQRNEFLGKLCQELKIRSAVLSTGFQRIHNGSIFDAISNAQEVREALVAEGFSVNAC